MELQSTFQHQNDHFLLPKRCIWYTSKGKGPDEKTLSEEKGLEEPGKVHPVDSQAAIFDQLSGVFTTTDPEAFAEKYEDVLDEMGKENAISIILSSRKIGEDLKWIIHEYLMDKFRKRASKKALDAIDELSARVGTPEGNDVAELAKEKLEGLAVGTWISDENEEPTYELQEVSEEEQTFYRSLADTVGALGMKKEDLERVNELTNRKKNLERRINALNGRLNRVQDYAKEVKKMRDEAINKAEWYDKAGAWIWQKFNTGLLSGGVGVLGSSLTVGSLALAGVTFPVFWPIVGGAALGAAITGGILRWTRVGNFLDRWRNNMKIPSVLRKSLKFQQDLLEKGIVTISAGDELKDFRIPKRGPGEAPNTIKIAPGGFIDKKPITEVIEAKPGQLVSGTVAGGVTLKIERKEEALLAQKTKETEEKTFVEKELREHQSSITKDKKDFDAAIKDLRAQIKDNKSAVDQSSMRLMSLQVKLAKAEEPEKTAITNEFEQEQRILSAARITLGRSEDALKAMEKVESLFKLNDQFQKTPVTKEVLESLYKGFHPELLDTIKKFAKEQDERTKKAQEVLGKVNQKQVDKWYKELSADDRTGVHDYLEEIQNAGTADEKLWGKMSDFELGREFPLLREMKRYHKDLYEMLISLPRLTLESRYPKGPAGYDDMAGKMLEMWEGAAAKEEGREEEGGDEENEEEGERNEALNTKRQEVITAYEALTTAAKTLPHLKGIEDVLDKNFEAIKEFISQNRGGENPTVYPTLIRNKGGFKKYIEKHKDVKELGKWKSLLEAIKEKCVVTRLDEKGKVRGDGKFGLETKEKMYSDVNTQLSELDKELANTNTTDFNNPLDFSQIEIISIDSSEGGKGPLKCLKDNDPNTPCLFDDLLIVKANGNPQAIMKGENENPPLLTDNANAKYLEAFRYNFRKLIELLKKPDNGNALMKVDEVDNKWSIVAPNPPNKSDTGNKERFVYVEENGDYKEILLQGAS